jgi:hypothetical protein
LYIGGKRAGARRASALNENERQRDEYREQGDPTPSVRAGVKRLTKPGAKRLTKPGAKRLTKQRRGR